MIDAIIRQLFAAVSGASGDRRLSILIFHRVPESVDSLFPGEMAREEFDRMCGRIAKWCHVLPLGEAIDRMSEGRLPRRALSITFDDGYLDNLEVAAPVLRRHGLPCTFFIATGFTDGSAMWNDVLIHAVRTTGSLQLDLRIVDPALGVQRLATVSDRRAAIDVLLREAKYMAQEERLAFVEAVTRCAGVDPPRDLMMNPGQLRKLAELGFELGAHTVSHPILARLSPGQAQAEIVNGKRQLETILGRPVELFAYPNGKPGTDYLPAHAAMVREAGFKAAVSTAAGASDRATDRFQLRRFTPWDRQTWRFGFRLAHCHSGR